MPDTLSPAATGRAKCRGCGGAISKGELRFGEAVPNAYAEGETFLWFHVSCASLMRPEKFAAFQDSLPEAERAALAGLTEAGIAHPRLSRIARAERASTGRAHCRHCRELIEKGAWRLSLQLLEDSRMAPIGFIHASCSAGYFGTRDTILDRAERLSEGLGAADFEELAAEVSKDSPPAVSREAQTEMARDAATESQSPEGTTPGLAKTRPESVAGPKHGTG